MESDARPPGKLSDKGPMSRNWKRWKQEFLIYMKLTGGMNKPEDEKAAWLKNLIGQVGLEALESISFDSPDDKENMTIIIQKLEELFDPPKNEIEERYKFFSRSKKASESIDAYIEDLKIISKLCNFGDQIESLVRDAVILDIKDKNLRKIVFEEKDLDLEKLKIIYKTYESNNAKMNDPKELIPEQGKSLSKKFGPRRPPEPKNPCWRCGEKHALRECPAHKNLCCYCKNYNHFSHRCPVAKLDSVQISNPGTNVAQKKPNNSGNPFNIEKDKPDKGYKNNLNSLQNDDKEKIVPKQKTLKSDPIVKNLETVDSGKPKKVENQFYTRSNYGKTQKSVPLESLLDLKIEKPTTKLSAGKVVFQSNKNKVLKSSEKGQGTSQSNHQVPVPQKYQFPREYYLLYPKLPKSTPTVPHTPQNNLQSNAGRGIPKGDPLKSDLVKNLKIVDSEKPRKVEKTFSTSSYQGQFQPSAPPESLLDLNIQKPRTENKILKSSEKLLSNATPSISHPLQESWESNASRDIRLYGQSSSEGIEKILKSSEKGETTSQSNSQVSRPQNYQFPKEYSPLYPKLPNSTQSLPHSPKNNLHSNARRGIPQPNYVSSSTNLTIRKEPAKSKEKSGSDCLLS
ncbi:uncharacterized protein LOC117180342 [Belonocnema kinseyi]|uniref:uncharacterized protein LOC117180342 n=1 Tax=Belonocnema kinseyi TaxID=2817044 RepID=UPI00143DF623|nr:uncharacterized protein LOC117180342 [Belonocnema kinseyi]XP_033228675.1 uncharacterized protein LOC117180342 [Belonocnema kinseyi]